jgi:NADH-quinone oxidoreductase subunit N
MKDYTFDGFNGLARHEPVLALTTSIFLLSLAGIPLTAGFFSKYYMLLSAMKNGHMFWLVIVGVICAAISVYYYFRVVQSMYFKDAEETPVAPVSQGFKTVLVVTALAVIFLGVKPGLLLNLLSL